MSWVRLDDGFADHPKVLKVGPIGVAIHLWAMCYCARFLTDGLVPIEALVGCPWVSKKDARATAVRRLEGAGLWEAVEGGYQIHDFLAYNPDAASVKEKRAKAAERQARWRERQKARHNAVKPSFGNAVTNASPTPPPERGGSPLSLNGGAQADAAPPIDDFCFGCDEKRRLVDAIYCESCFPKVELT